MSLKIYFISIKFFLLTVLNPCINLIIKFIRPPVAMEKAALSCCFFHMYPKMPVPAILSPSEARWATASCLSAFHFIDHEA